VVATYFIIMLFRNTRLEVIALATWLVLLSCWQAILLLPSWWRRGVWLLCHLVFVTGSEPFESFNSVIWTAICWATIVQSLLFLGVRDPVPSLGIGCRHVPSGHQSYHRLRLHILSQSLCVLLYPRCVGRCPSGVSSCLLPYGDDRIRTSRCVFYAARLQDSGTAPFDAVASCGIHGCKNASASTRAILASASVRPDPGRTADRLFRETLMRNGAVSWMNWSRLANDGPAPGNQAPATHG